MAKSRIEKNHRLHIIAKERTYCGIWIWPNQIRSLLLFNFHIWRSHVDDVLRKLVSGQLDCSENRRALNYYLHLKYIFNKKSQSTWFSTVLRSRSCKHDLE